MAVRIHNTLTGRTEPLEPLEPGHVRMYVCGMTTYDYTHLGHGRLFVAFDVVQRWLRANGLRVTYVRNITDIDDKIIRRAAERGEPIAALTERFIGYMREDFAALGVQTPDLEPRATEYVPPMLELIERLQAKGLAYLADDGDVNFAVRNFPEYGRLSHRNLDELRAGERVAVLGSKRDPLDFVLWKHARPEEPQWPSPWGPGRPGWHIECTAMSMCLLGETLDIHGGGLDLQFPHHENELAQAESLTGKPFARYWMHNGLMKVGTGKMSKSFGNEIVVTELLQHHPAETLRFFLLTTHYRRPIDYSEERLDEVQRGLEGFYRFFERYQRITGGTFYAIEAPTGHNQFKPDGAEREFLAEVARHRGAFLVCMDDDFN